MAKDDVNTVIDRSCKLWLNVIFGIAFIIFRSESRISYFHTFTYREEYFLRVHLQQIDIIDLSVSLSSQNRVRFYCYRTVHFELSLLL